MNKYTSFTHSWRKPLTPCVIRCCCMNLKIAEWLVYLYWVASYLTNHEQSVIVWNATARLVFAALKVQQGSHLRPVLFSIYINNTCNFKDCAGHSYADDLTFFARLNRLLSDLKPKIVSFSCCYDPMPHNCSLTNIILERVFWHWQRHN